MKSTMNEAIPAEIPNEIAETPKDRGCRVCGVQIHLIMGLLGVVAASSLVVQHGFRIPPETSFWINWLDVLLAAAFAAGLATECSMARNRREAIHQRRFEIFILGGLITALVLPWLLPGQTLEFLMAATSRESVTELNLSVIQLFLLGNVCVQLLHSLQRIFEMGVRTELLLAGSFGALIFAGTILLLLPRASAKPDAPLTLVDCLFTATSAVCVTGLGVRDTGTDFTTFGQLIIVTLCQIGGLGIATFIAFVSVFSRKTLPVPQMVAFREMINAPAMTDLKRQISGILLLTGIIELLGIICLFTAAPAGMDIFQRLKWSVFHSISAFCNAGFALHADSLESVRVNAVVNWTIMGLIVLGGLGFLVLPELLRAAWHWLRQIPLLFQPVRRRFLQGPRTRLSIQTRISLRISLLLIVVGMGGFWLLESGHLLSGKDSRECFLVSMFQSVTARTAGFNTVPMGALQQSTLILIIMLMVVGGSPVSTAGGIKTVTFGILLLALRSLILQKRSVEAFGRTLPARAFFTALNVFVLYVVTAGLGIFLISIFDPAIALRDSAFETISALSTVGLSTGITAGLSIPSKLTLCAAMFIGRVGPIALVLAVFQSRGVVEYEFPQEDVVVG